MAQADVPFTVRPTELDSRIGGDPGSNAKAQTGNGSGKRASSGVIGYARQMSHPAYERLLQSENFLKKLVPLLILILLIVVGVAHWVSISNQASETAEAARAEMHFIAELIELKTQTLSSPLVGPLAGPLAAPLAAEPLDSNRDNTADNTADKDILLNLLASAVPERYQEKGRSALITGSDGVIIATIPVQKEIIGKPLEAVLGDTSLLTTFGRTADTIDLDTPAYGPAIATYRSLDLPLGGVAIVQSNAELFASWHHNLSLNVMLYVAMSSIFLIILYAYIAQATRAREADEIYNKTQTRFDTALTRGRCGLWDWSLSQGCIYWSASMFAMLGMEGRDDVLGFHAVTRFIHPGDVDLYQLAQRVLENDRSHVDQMFRMRHKDGHWVWIRTRCEVVIADDGEKHLIGIAVDVTEQENMREAGVQKDMRLHDAIESLSEAFVLWDADNQLVLCNNKYAQLHALDMRAVRPGMKFDDVMAHSARPLVTHHLVSGDRRNNGTRIQEAQLDDGRWLQITERKTNDGGHVSVGTDITALKLQEAKLIESQNSLTKTVADLTQARRKAEDQTNQLTELARKYAIERNNAEAANKIKSEFLANISHEWRTPLNAIIGFSEIMVANGLGRIDEAKYREYAHDIHASGVYLLGVINDILDMSKIEAGRMTLEYESFALNETMEETIRIVAYQASNRKIEIIGDISPKVELEADRRAIKQILINLLSNAVKFTREGGKIAVRAKKVGDSICISIKDNGIGISKENLKRLGRPFEQVQNQFTKAHQGSGLGLAISRSLTEAHGGALRMRSKPGKGTIVSLRFPVKRSPGTGYQFTAAA